MPASRCYVTTAIPYVNARPHLGHALELVQADTLARHRRQAGDAVRLLTGTDDNSLKNVQAAEAEGVPVQRLVDRYAAAFAALRGPLALSFDDFIRTSSDPRHRAGVERLWRACAAAGDLYRRRYQGLYCVGCERFYQPDELQDGRCPEHAAPLEPVAEENWFFRLSRYREPLLRLLRDGRLRVEPAVRRNEVLAFVAAGLEDFSVSRSVARARGWGIPVPGDPGQVVYVWFDALANYVSALGYGIKTLAHHQRPPDPEGDQGGRRGDAQASLGDDAYRDWWLEGGRRVHLIGKGILRFHAVYWPAMLLSAGEPPPTDVLVHDHLTVDGRKLSKSSGNVVDPVALAERFGTDAVRWWLLRDVPRVGDADFTVARLVARADEDLANGLGNLVNRVVSMVHRYRGGHVPAAAGAGGEAAGPLRLACARAPARVAQALATGDFRAGAAAVWAIVEEANRYVDRARPWELAAAERAGEAAAGARLDAALAALAGSLAALAEQLRPFLPDAAERVAAQCDGSSGTLPEARPLFPRLAAPGRAPAGSLGR
jgi:methionyl-tRNA synthetase